jgi:hypothetical protein
VVIGSRHRDREKRTDRGDTRPPGLVAKTGWAGKHKRDRTCTIRLHEELK